MLAGLLALSPAAAKDELARLSAGSWGSPFVATTSCAINPHHVRILDGGRIVRLEFARDLEFPPGTTARHYGPARRLSDRRDRQEPVDDGDSQ
jgi:hypothetical protein